MRWRLPLLCFVWLSGSSSASGQTSLTFEDAVQRARVRAPEILAAAARIDEARGRVVGASIRWRDNPMLEVDAGPRIGSGQRSADLAAAFGQTFETGGQRDARILAAQSDVSREQALSEETARQIVSAVAVSYLRAVGLQERVRLLDGSVRRSHGLLAHAVLRRVLDHIVATATAPLDSRDLVVTTLGSHAQEVDALVVAAAAAAEGWRVTYVGSRVPADDVVDTLEHLEAPLLVLSLAAPPGDREVPRELRRLRAMLPAPIEVLVVGSTADVHRSSIVDTGATPLGGLTELRAHLRERHAAARGARRARGASRRRAGAR